MDIFVLLYNFGTDKEGIHSIELKGRTIVLMFEDKDDAERCLLYTSPSPRDRYISRMPSSA